MADTHETRPGPSLELLAYADDLLCGTGISVETVLAMPLDGPPAGTRNPASDEELSSGGPADEATEAESAAEPLAVLRAGWTASLLHHVSGTTGSDTASSDTHPASLDGARP